MAQIEDIYPIVEDYFDTTAKMSDWINVIAQPHTGAFDYERLQQSRGQPGSIQGKFMEVYDYLVLEFPDDIEAMRAIIESDDIADVNGSPVTTEFRSWKESALKSLDRISKYLDNFIRSVERSDGRQAQKDFNVLNGRMVNIVGFVNAVERELGIED